jgi:6-phosphogluconate dehydrogenase
MKIGMVGLGRMGANMAQRLLLGGHEVTAFDPNADARKALAAKGASSVDSLRGLVNALLVPRFIWLMVPSGKITEDTVAELLPLLSPGDVVIDGGNSNYKDTLRRAEQYRAKALGYVDAGTSGGVWGLKEGYSLMVGGDAENIATLQPIFATLAPDECRGWGHVGPVGSGHFTKMIHNGIEYGLMQAYAEGFSILAHKREFSLDLHQIGEIWRHGSVVRSWLLDLATDALNKNPTLDGIAPYVPDSGEGRWTASEAIELDVPAPIITLSLIARLRSRDNDSFSDKLLSAMRNEFGGHAMKRET